MADLSARAGIVLDAWQELILRAAMGERSDALWAAKRVGVSIPRQNGKSQLLVARALAGALLFGEKKIVISAHMADTARETFGKFIEIHDDEANQWIRDRIRPNGIMYAINRESIKFKNGATIQFKARTGSGGRGFSSDCLMLDEAQRLKRAAWVSINSTMSAMENPQVWLLGTPPTRDDIDAGMGEVFTSIRSAAIDGVSTAAAWAEWGADPKAADYEPSSELTRWQANPAWNTRINHEIVQGEFESYTVEEFSQDRLGVWLSEIGEGTRAISREAWREVGVAAAPVDGVPSYGVAFSLDGSRVSLGGAFKHDDGVHLEIIDAGDASSGLVSLADWFVAESPRGGERWRWAAAIVLAGAAGASVLKQLLIDRRVPEQIIHILGTPMYLTACGMLDDSVKARSVSHLLDNEGQSVLDESVSVTDKDRRGGWIATTKDGDETPIESVSLALWGARTSKHKPRGDRERKAVFL